jgi:hypothetical protein
MSAVRPLPSLVFSLAVLALMVAPLAALADIPGPGPRPRRPVEREPAPVKAGAPLEVVLQEGDKPLKLEIPRGLLPKEVAAKRGGVFGGLDGFRTVVAGLALSLAVAVAGVWLARRFAVAGSRPLPKAATVATIAVLVVAGFAVATAWADLIPPGAGPRSRPRPVPAAAGLTIQIEVVEGGDKIVLHASPADLAKMAARKAEPRFGSAPPGARE